jgi:cob(I)alamin adenosyltransferase
MVYTGRGDAGRTDLSSGERVSKSSERVEAYGTLDEANSIIGMARNKAQTGENERRLKQMQNHLHALQAEIACRGPDVFIEKGEVEYLEDVCDKVQSEIPPLTDFVLAGGAGGCESGALLHHARSVTRRAERRIVDLHGEEELRSPVLSYVNRLSDALFLMARHENQKAGVEEENPSY